MLSNSTPPTPSGFCAIQDRPKYGANGEPAYMSPCPTLAMWTASTHRAELVRIGLRAHEPVR